MWILFIKLSNLSIPAHTLMPISPAYRFVVCIPNEKCRTECVCCFYIIKNFFFSFYKMNISYKWLPTKNICKIVKNLNISVMKKKKKKLELLRTLPPTQKKNEQGIFSNLSVQSNIFVSIISFFLLKVKMLHQGSLEHAASWFFCVWTPSLFLVIFLMTARQICPKPWQRASQQLQPISDFGKISQSLLWLLLTSIDRKR